MYLLSGEKERRFFAMENTENFRILRLFSVSSVANFKFS